MVPQDKHNSPLNLNRPPFCPKLLAVRWPIEASSYLKKSGTLTFSLFLFLLVSLRFHYLKKKAHFSICACSVGQTAQAHFSYTHLTSIFVLFLAPSAVARCRQKKTSGVAWCHGGLQDVNDLIAQVLFKLIIETTI